MTTLGGNLRYLSVSQFKIREQKTVTPRGLAVYSTEMFLKINRQTLNQRTMLGRVICTAVDVHFQVVQVAGDFCIAQLFCLRCQ